MSINNDYSLNCSGSLTDGLAASCVISGQHYVSQKGLNSFEQMIAVLHSFARKDGQWRMLIDWC